MSNFKAFDKVLPSFSVWSLYYEVGDVSKVLFFSTEELLLRYKGALKSQYGGRVKINAQECRVNDEKEYGETL